MTPAPVSIINFEALKKSASALSMGLTWPRECTPRPLRGATRPYVPAGTATDIWVSTRPFPRAGIVMSTALFAFYSLLYIKSAYYRYLYRSYPADNEEPLVGNLAFSDSRLIKSLVGAVVSVSSSEDTFLFLVWESDIEVRRRNASVHVQRSLLDRKRTCSVYGLSESLSLPAVTIVVKFVRLPLHLISLASILKLSSHQNDLLWYMARCSQC